MKIICLILKDHGCLQCIQPHFQGLRYKSTNHLFKYFVDAIEEWAGSRIHLCKLSTMGAWTVSHCLPDHWTDCCTDPCVQTRQDWTLASRVDASSFGNWLQAALRRLATARRFQSEFDWKYHHRCRRQEDSFWYEKHDTSGLSLHYQDYCVLGWLTVVIERWTLAKHRWSICPEHSSLLSCIHILDKIIPCHIPIIIECKHLFNVDVANFGHRHFCDVIFYNTIEMCPWRDWYNVYI